MLPFIQKKLINALWMQYQSSIHQTHIIQNALAKHCTQTIPLDHFAIIDLSSPHSGISQLKYLFELLEFTPRGKGYLPEKQNDFLWLAKKNNENQVAKDSLPQVVVADFRIEIMPTNIQSILQKYTQHIKPFPEKLFHTLIINANTGDESAYQQLETAFLNYLNSKDWPQPSVADFQVIADYNELLAWVLVFGRRPNHFTFSVHLIPGFHSLLEFLDFLKIHTKLQFNLEGGLIKGDKTKGIAQASTLGTLENINVHDGTLTLPTGFIEFVWRYPNAHCPNPIKWADYYTGFIAQQANLVIESLY